MDDQNNPLDALASAYEFDAVDGAKNAADSSETLTLSEINTLIGRDYKDKDTAFKALKNTYNMVSKVGELEKENKNLMEKLTEPTSAADEIKQIKEQLFYSENPEYKPYKDIIKDMGVNPADAVAKESFKAIFTNLSEFEKTKNAKSVLETNPRIGQAVSKLDQAKDLSTKGQYSSANESAVSAVMDLYDMK